MIPQTVLAIIQEKSTAQTEGTKTSVVTYMIFYELTCSVSKGTTNLLTLYRMYINANSNLKTFQKHLTIHRKINL
jgi:hypothetical protein